MKTIFRNFYTTLRCYKMASALNITGLSVAFATFVILIMQVHYESNFDRNYPDAERIYRVERSWDSTSYSPIMSRPAIEVLITAAPQIEAGTLTCSYRDKLYMTYEKNGSLVGIKEEIIPVFPDFARVFGLDFVEGGDNVLENYGKVIIPLSMAQRMYGDESAVGKLLFAEEYLKEDGSKESHEIGGVYRDFSENSSQANKIYARMEANDDLGNWGNDNYYAYIKLLPGASVEETTRLLNETFAKVEKPGWDSSNPTIRLSAVPDLYYMERMNFDTAPKGDRATTSILLAIALLIVVIAGINFVNFATSLTPIRIKSINTQKVLGSSVASLRTAMVFEAVGISVIAWLLSLLWIKLLADLNFSEYLLAAIRFEGNLPILMLSLGVALATGLLAGFYPAIYTTSFPPALVLKGSFGMSPKGKQLRTGLIGFQFVISLTLIIAALFLQLQNRYMRQHDNGFQQEQVAVVNLGEKYGQGEIKKVIDNELKASPLIADVAYAQHVIGSNDNYLTWGRQIKGSNREAIFTCLPVSYNFAEMMGLEIVEGRHFNESDLQNAYGSYIFNQTAQRQYSLTLEEEMRVFDNNYAPIVGIVKDFNFKSLRLGIEPMAFFEFGNVPRWELAAAYVKIVGDPFAAVDHIKKTLQKIDPNYPIEITFYDEIFNNLYQKERKTTAMITAFSILAVIISLVGIFGIVLFETQFRRKEIGIRKVYGSTVGEILLMLNRKFVIIVAVCFVIATPVAYYGVSNWLGNFAYRTPLHWWVFVVALIIVAFITLLTVNIQSYRAATENPVKSIKSE